MSLLRNLAPNHRVLHEFEVTLANVGDEFIFADLDAVLTAARINSYEGLWIQTQQPDTSDIPYVAITNTGEDLSAVRGEYMTGFSQFAVPCSNISSFKLRAKVAGALFRVKVYG